MVRSVWLALVLVACTGSPPASQDLGEDPVAGTPVEAPAEAPADERVEPTEAAAVAGVEETDAPAADTDTTSTTEAPPEPRGETTTASTNRPPPPPLEVDDEEIEDEPEVEEPADAAATADPQEAVDVDEAEPEPEPEPAGPVDYALTPRGSFVAVLVRYDRSALVGGHDHVLVAKAFDGRVSWTSGDASACAIAVRVPARSLSVDPPGSRERVGFEGSTPEKDKGKILANALGKSQLDASRHPDLRFRATSCSGSGDKVTVKGVLTIRGKDKNVTLPMRITEDGSSFSARGRVSFSHGDFGFKPFTAALGALRNDDKLTLELNFNGTKS